MGCIIGTGSRLIGSDHSNKIKSPSVRATLYAGTLTIVISSVGFGAILILAALYPMGPLNALSSCPLAVGIVIVGGGTIFFVVDTSVGAFEIIQSKSKANETLDKHAEIQVKDEKTILKTSNTEKSKQGQSKSKHSKDSESTSEESSSKSEKKKESERSSSKLKENLPYKADRATSILKIADAEEREDALIKYIQCTKIEIEAIYQYDKEDVIEKINMIIEFKHKFAATEQYGANKIIREILILTGLLDQFKKQLAGVKEDVEVDTKSLPTNVDILCIMYPVTQKKAYLDKTKSLLGRGEILFLNGSNKEGERNFNEALALRDVVKDEDLKRNIIFLFHAQLDKIYFSLDEEGMELVDALRKKAYNTGNIDSID